MRKIISVILIFLIVLNTYSVSYGEDGNDDKRACWISFLDFEQYLIDQDEETFRANVASMYANIRKHDLDTVIVHVRAMGDAIYPSLYFPMAEWISSDRSPLSYDSLEIMVEEAKKAGLCFEAWINPYRLSRDQESTDSFKKTNFYNQFKDFTIEYTNASGESCLSLDPSREETITLINCGVQELLNNYDIKNIHFDDYFYVDGMMDSLDVEIKKENVNNMVKTVYATVHSFGDEYIFGISPAGNTENARNQGADIDTWLSTEGYVDYIMPQIYWSDSFNTENGVECLYSNRCGEWMALNKLDLPIYVGLALYRVGEVSLSDYGWSESDSNLMQQYSIAKNIGYDGFSLFRYAWLENRIADSELENMRTYLEALDEERKTAVVLNTDTTKIATGTDAEVDMVTETDTEHRLERDSGMFFFGERNVFVSYSCNKEGLGWQKVSCDMQVSGEENNNFITAVRLKLGEKAGYGSILYRYYDNSSGWQDWLYDGEYSNVSSDYKISALQIKLSGDVVDYYDVCYRVYSDNNGWSRWCFNGETAGELKNDSISFFQVLLVPKNAFAGCNGYLSNMW